jgi:hypothetical protein
MNQSKPEQNKTKRFEEYEDGLWQVLMYNYAEHEGNELLEETAPLKDDPQYQPSDAEQKKFRNMLNGELRKHTFDGSNASVSSVGNVTMKQY